MRNKNFRGQCRTCLLCLCFTLFPVLFQAAAGEKYPQIPLLPETVGEWRTDRFDVTPFVLSASSEDVGQWTRCVYTREAPRASIEAGLMTGSGPGSLRIPNAEPEAGLFESEGDYQILTVAGHRAVLESYPFLPLALAVQAGPDTTLTLESPTAGREELVRVAGEILKRLETLKSF